MEELLTLRGIAFSKYPNITKLAEKMGWSRQKTTRIINRVQEPTEDEMVKLVEAFDVSPELIMSIFFPKMFTMCTEKGDIGKGKEVAS
jgi:plasmid maintenance system antidote protein VapI